MNTTLHSAHELAKVLRSTTTAIVKKLADAGIEPTHIQNVGDGNRTFRFYDKNALGIVTTWRKRLDAVHAANDAKKNAKRQRAMARRIKEANTIALTERSAPVLKPLELRLTQSVDDLSARIELLIGAVDMLSKRVDSLQARTQTPAWPPLSAPPFAPQKWESTCDAGAGTFSLADMQNEIAAYIDEPVLSPR